MENTGSLEALAGLEWDIDPLIQQVIELSKIQAKHDAQFRESGMYDKAILSDDITEEDYSKMNDETVASVHIFIGIDNDYNYRHSGKIRFVTPSGILGRPYVAYADVVYSLPEYNSLHYGKGFGIDEAEIFLGMIAELSRAKEDGSLSNL